MFARNALKLGQAVGFPGSGPILYSRYQQNPRFFLMRCKLTIVGVDDECFMKAMKAKVLSLMIASTGKHKKEETTPHRKSYLVKLHDFI